MASIVEILAQAPAQLEAQTLKVIEAEKNFKLAKAKLSAARAAYTLKYKDEKNSKITEAYVEAEEDVTALVLAEIEAEAAAKIARNRAAAIENQWLSARKLGGMTEQEVQAARGASILSHNDR